jgi:hypothetical protein
MSRTDDQPIDYDVRRSWSRRATWTSRELTSADRPGLRAIRDRSRIQALVAPGAPDDEPGWAIEYDSRLIGAVTARRAMQAIEPSPHPWAPAERALRDTEHASLELESAWWDRDCRLDAVDVIIEVVCNAVQRDSLVEARVELPIPADETDPTAWLMELHADVRATRWDDEPLALFLRAGFYLQGWIENPSGAPRARLNWPNRAR